MPTSQHIEYLIIVIAIYIALATVFSTRLLRKLTTTPSRSWTSYISFVFKAVLCFALCNAFGEWMTDQLLTGVTHLFMATAVESAVFVACTLLIKEGMIIPTKRNVLICFAINTVAVLLTAFFLVG